MKTFIIYITLIFLSSCKIIKSEKQDLPIEDSSTPKTIIINEDGTSITQEGEQPISEIPFDSSDDEENSQSIPVQIEHQVSITETVDPPEPSSNTYPLISSQLIPNEAIPYVSLFVFYGNLFGRSLVYSKLIIEFENSPSSFYVAYCSSVNNNQNKKIKINNDFWKNLSEIYKSQLMAHELGHCLLNRPHQGNDFQNPTSIMNGSLFSDYLFVNEYDRFIKELFQTPISNYQFEYGKLRPNE